MHRQGFGIGVEDRWGQEAAAGRSYRDNKEQLATISAEGRILNANEHGLTCKTTHRLLVKSGMECGHISVRMKA
jgi:hypothetical protein